MANNPNSGLSCLALDDGLAQHLIKQYAERDAEFEAWFGGLDLPSKESRTTALRIAFNAGWAARKKTALKWLYGLDKPKAE